ncbi:MAG: HEPN domain-containing protein [Geopsychrobacter sp.]|nr:HEPN domain-containing protein [Geopsychrobacter sp.]
MKRSDFQEIAKTRVKEAHALLGAGHFSGAYYLIGYAIECALKACVAKQVKLYDFPNKKLANEAFTHDLEKLMRVAGLSPEFERDKNANSALAINWAVVKDWSEAKRYELGITEAQARDIYSACTTRTNGILPWIKKKW